MSSKVIGHRREQEPVRLAGHMPRALRPADQAAFAPGGDNHGVLLRGVGPPEARRTNKMPGAQATLAHGIPSAEPAMTRPRPGMYLRSGRR